MSAIPSSSVSPPPTSELTPRLVPVSLLWVSLVVPLTHLSKVPLQTMSAHGDRSSSLLLVLFLWWFMASPCGSSTAGSTAESWPSGTRKWVSKGYFFLNTNRCWWLAIDCSQCWSYPWSSSRSCSWEVGDSFYWQRPESRSRFQGICLNQGFFHCIQIVSEWA